MDLSVLNKIKLKKEGVATLQVFFIFAFSSLEYLIRHGYGIVTGVVIFLVVILGNRFGRAGVAYAAAVTPPLAFAATALFWSVISNNIHITKLLVDLIGFKDLGSKIELWYWNKEKEKSCCIVDKQYIELIEDIGLKDKNDKDDVAKAGNSSVAVGSLKPMQKEVIPEKALSFALGFAENGQPDLNDMEAITSSDGYIMDGHHRWAAIVAYNAKHPDKQIPMKVEVIDMPIKEAIPMCNEFAQNIGIAAKKQGETTGKAGEEPKKVSSIKPESFTDKIKAKLSNIFSNIERYFS